MSSLVAAVLPESGEKLRSFLGRLKGVRKSGLCWEALCPAHADRKPSLRVSEGREGRILIRCQAGCSWEAVLHALGVEASELFSDACPLPSVADRPRGCIDTYDYRSESGELLFQVCRFGSNSRGGKRFLQRRPWKGSWAWGLSAGLYHLGKDGAYRPLKSGEDPQGADELPPIEKVLYRLPDVKEAIAGHEPIVICEGEKDANRGAALGLATTTNPGGAGKWNGCLTAALRGARIVIVPDNDAPGKRSADAIRMSLEQEGIEARIVDLGGTTKGYDLSDWIDDQKRLGRAEHEILAAFWQRAEEPDIEAARATERQRIVLSTDEETVIDRALLALSGSEAIYRRGGTLVQVVSDGPRPSGIAGSASAPTIQIAAEARIREVLSSRAFWEAPNGQSAHPPVWVVRGLLARGSWPHQRSLEGVVESPVLRHDGSILDRPGYDQETGLVFLPNGLFRTVAPNSSRDQAREAVKELLDVVVDFPFSSPAHRSSWLSAVLSLQGRYAFSGPVPLHLIDANVRGAGKSLLADLVSVIVLGREAARMSQAESEAEERKKITSIGLAGSPLVLIDNITRPLGSAALDAALTGSIWTDRLLGVNTQISLPLRIVWLATGNNVALVGDTSRRCVHIRLDSPEEFPESRQRFKHPRLLDWARKRRPELVAAGLTILSAFVKAGSPDQGLRPLGSFEGWWALIRNAIVWVGEADPGETREILQTEADRDYQHLDRLLLGWKEATDLFARSITIAEVLSHLEREPGALPILRSVFAEFSSIPGQLPCPRSLGNSFKSFRGRVVHGRALQVVGKLSLGYKWAVVTVGSGEVAKA